MCGLHGVYTEFYLMFGSKKSFPGHFALTCIFIAQSEQWANSTGNTAPCWDTDATLRLPAVQTGPVSYVLDWSWSIREGVTYVSLDNIQLQYSQKWNVLFKKRALAVIVCKVIGTSE